MEGITKHTYTWTIENFRACSQKNGDCLKSPVFVAESFDKTTWSIHLYPKGKDISSKEFISCFLYRSIDCTGPEKFESDFTIVAIDGNNETLKFFIFESGFKKGQYLGWDNFLKRERLLNTNACLSLDTFTIQVTLKKRMPNIFTQNSCRTKIATDHFSFIWNVNSITSAENIRSVSFSEDLQFEIKIEIPEDDVEISIRITKGFTNSEKMVCFVTLLDLKGNETDSKESILEADDPDENYTWNFPTFLNKSKIVAEKDKYLENDYFTLRFDFAHSNGKRKDIECRSLDQSLMSKKDFSASLKTDLKHVLTNNIHTDVVLHVDEEELHAHKVILCARSPVFLTMFNQNMIEKQRGVINISDIEADTLKSLLEFMYTGDAEIETCESALKLLLVSDRYQVLSLKEKCSSALESLLSDENVCDVLFTADLVQQESLKVCAVSHIKNNSKKIFKSDEWKQFIEKNLKLASEIVSEVSIFLAT